MGRTILKLTVVIGLLFCAFLIVLNSFSIAVHPLKAEEKPTPLSNPESIEKNVPPRSLNSKTVVQEPNLIFIEKINLKPDMEHLFCRLEYADPEMGIRIDKEPDKSYKLPFRTLIKLDKLNQLIEIELGKNSNSHLIITGRFPDTLSLLIIYNNSTHIFPYNIPKSGQFYHKILKEELSHGLAIEFVFFKRP
ncbi:hypothetical protein ACFL96_11910 [Thermoproteota archaeon]